MDSATLGPCYARLEAGILTIGNEQIEHRLYVAGGGQAQALSLTDKHSAAWVREPAAEDASPDQPTTFAVEEGAQSVVGEPSLCVTVTGAGGTLEFRIFAASSAVVVRRRQGIGADTGIAEAVAGEPSGVETEEAASSTAAPGAPEGLFSLALAPHHLRLTAVTLRDQTDAHNELVFESEWLLHPAERSLTLQGCLFYLEDVLTERGLIVLKQAPLPHARPEKTEADIVVDASRRALQIAGGDDYPVALICYEGGTFGRIAALQQYQRCLRRYEPGRDALLLSNTWGDRGRDGRVSETFLRGEIEAGARLGVDVVQIDDGWQRGTTANSVHAQTAGGVWEGFWKADPAFWTPHPERFPNGLAPLVEEARAKGLRFGLWFAPDSTDDFANWSRDADTLLGLHREYGIDYFKIDGVKLRTKAGERHLRAFFDRVLRESGGRVVFDCDVTAEVRPGYFGLPDAGPLFVENRYTDWHRYWPHATLRNLWKLVHHVDPVRLRMEWLNHARNAEKYEGDPLAPALYSPATLFATVMCSSPLGWFEVQNLPESYFTEAAPLIAVWKQHREAFFSGTILPIGDAPDGASWTGFVSLAADQESGYLVYFREAHPHQTKYARIPALPGEHILPLWSAKVLAGTGIFPKDVNPIGIQIEIKEPFGFVFARFTRGDYP